MKKKKKKTIRKSYQNIMCKLNSTHDLSKKTTKFRKK